MKKSNIEHEAEAMGMSIDQYHEMKMVEAENRAYTLAKVLCGKKNSECTITIAVERYNELMKADIKLEIIKKALEKDDTQYGYSSDTKRVIDAVLGITRE